MDNFMNLVRVVAFMAPFNYSRAFAAWLAAEFVTKALRAQKSANLLSSVSETISEKELADLWGTATRASKPAVKAFAVMDLAFQIGRTRAQKPDDGFARALVSFEYDVPVESYTNVEAIAAAAPKLVLGGDGVVRPAVELPQHLVL